MMSLWWTSSSRQPRSSFAAAPTASDVPFRGLKNVQPPAGTDGCALLPDSGGFEHVLARAAYGTNPSLGHFFERCPRFDTVIGISYFRIIDVLADCAYPSLHFTPPHVSFHPALHSAERFRKAHRNHRFRYPRPAGFMRFSAKIRH